MINQNVLKSHFFKSKQIYKISLLQKKKKCFVNLFRNNIIFLNILI
jgi:hypothetical protein